MFGFLSRFTRTQGPPLQDGSGKPAPEKPTPFGRVLSDAQVQRITDDPERLLRRVEVDAAREREFAEAISVALQKTCAVSRVPSEGPTQFAAVPASDIVLRSRALPDAYGAIIANALTQRHGQFCPEFRVAAIPTRTVRKDTIEVHFGRGVFVPPPSQEPMADLEFATSETDGEPGSDGRPVQTQTPTLRGDGGAGADRPAAWYRGQVGLAVGFRPGAAPATLSANALGDGWGETLDDVILFFGRRSDSETPRIERLGGGGVFAERQNWHVQDGVWQFIDVKGRKLWFRFSSRTGGGFFSPDADAIRRKAKKGLERMREQGRRRSVGLATVEGVIMPPMPLPLGEYGRWRLDFQENGDIRHSDACGLAVTVAAQTFARYAAFDHQAGAWRGEGSGAGARGLPIGPGLRLQLRDLVLDAWADGAQAGPRDIYSARACLLERRDEAKSYASPLGAFPLVSRRRETDKDVDWIDVVAAPLAPSAPQISLSWLNCAAHVDGAQSHGLATHWLSRFKLSAAPLRDRLDVRVVAGSKEIEYAIPTGESGPLGPLWIRYDWLGGAP